MLYFPQLSKFPWVFFPSLILYLPGAVRCPTLFEYYPDLYDCGKFYRCVWGETESFSCPSGTLWAQSFHTCDHAEKVKCKPSSSLLWADRFGHKLGEISIDTPDFSYAESSTWDEDRSEDDDDDDSDSGERDSENDVYSNILFDRLHRPNFGMSDNHRYDEIGSEKEEWKRRHLPQLKDKYGNIPFPYDDRYTGRHDAFNLTKPKFHLNLGKDGTDMRRYKDEKKQHKQDQHEKEEPEQEKEEDGSDYDEVKLELLLENLKKHYPKKTQALQEEEEEEKEEEEEEEEEQDHDILSEKSKRLEKLQDYKHISSEEENEELERIEKHERDLEQHKKELEQHRDQVLALEELQRELSEELRRGDSEDDASQEHSEEEEEEQERIRKHQEELEERMKEEEEKRRKLKEELERRMEEEERIKRHEHDLEQQQERVGAAPGADNNVRGAAATTGGGGGIT